MKVLVVHPQFSVLGGAERVALTILDALENLGLEPTVLTTEIPNEAALQNFTGSRVNLKKTVWKEAKLPGFVSGRRSNLFRVRQCFIQRLALDASKSQKLAISTYNELAFSCPGIQYVHHPTWISGEVLSKFEIYATKRSRYKSVFENLYRNSLLSSSGASISDFSRNLTFTNSQFIKRIVDEWLNIDSTVLYPGLTNVQSVVEPGIRENRLLMLGRFSPDKKWLEFIPTLRTIIQTFPDFHIDLAGSSSDPDYLRLVLSFLEPFQSNVKVHLNPTSDEIFTLMCHAKFYVNPKPFEHFGISTVEAIRCGCVPIVHDSGGSPEIVVEENFRYRSADDLLSILSDVIARPTIALAKLKALQRMTVGFTEETFRSDFMKHVDQYLRRK